MKGFFYTPEGGTADTSVEQVLKTKGKGRSEDWQEGFKEAYGMKTEDKPKYYGPWTKVALNVVSRIGGFFKWSLIGFGGYYFGKIIIYLYLIYLGGDFLLESAPGDSIAGAIISFIKSLVG